MGILRMSVFEVLVKYGILDKVVDIAEAMGRQPLLSCLLAITTYVLIGIMISHVASLFAKIFESIKTLFKV